MAKSQKTTKNKKKLKIYKVSVLKDHTFDLDEILEWAEVFCNNKVFYQKYKKNVVFTFNNIDDAFDFKMQWEIA